MLYSPRTPVATLLRLGVDLNMRDGAGWLPLDCYFKRFNPIWSRDFLILKWLVTYGADLDLPSQADPSKTFRQLLDPKRTPFDQLIPNPTLDRGKPTNIRLQYLQSILPKKEDSSCQIL